MSFRPSSKPPKTSADFDILNTSLPYHYVPATASQALYYYNDPCQQPHTGADFYYGNEYANPMTSAQFNDGIPRTGAGWKEIAANFPPRYWKDYKWPESVNPYAKPVMKFLGGSISAGMALQGEEYLEKYAHNFLKS